MDMHEILEQLVALEMDVTYRDPPAGGDFPFRYEPGTLPVLLSAPHGAAHWRDGRYKQEDEYTAAFARLLARQTGAHVLYARAFSDNDPNWDRESPYKTALGTLVRAHNIRFVADIHGMSNRHNFGIAVGTMHGASCRRQQATLVSDALAAADFIQSSPQEVKGFASLHWDRYVIDHSRFTGGLTSHTVTRFAAEELGIYAAQFELCACLRVVRRLDRGHRPGGYRGDPAGIARTVAAFEQLIYTLAS